MTQLGSSAFERKLAGAYSLVACLGFVTDASVLSVAVHFGMQPAWARVFSLAAAMQVTFWINGLYVFRCLSRQSWRGAWLGYMATNGFGNLCNYWVFVTLVSLHSPLWSNRWLDLVIGGLTAWTINYSCARFLIFGAKREGSGDGCTSITEVIQAMSARFGLAKAKNVPAGEDASAFQALKP